MIIHVAQIGLAGIFMISAVAMGGQSDTTAGAEQSATAAKITRKEVFFEDSFTRDDLGDQYEILKHDANRLVVGDGKLMIVANNPDNNLVMLGQTPTGDFVATVAVTMQLTVDNHESGSLRLSDWLLRSCLNYRLFHDLVLVGGRPVPETAKQ